MDSLSYVHNIIIVLSSFTDIIIILMRPEHSYATIAQCTGT